MNIIKHLTGVLIDEGGNIIDLVQDGIEDGRIIVTNDADIFEEIRERILDELLSWLN